MLVRPLLACLGAAAGLLAALPAAAGATGALTVEDACVRTGEVPQPLRVSGSGFAPDQPVTVLADGQAIGATVADATGAFTASYPPPPLASPGRRQERFELTAGDALGTVAPPVTVRVTRGAVSLPERARPTARVAYRAYGFRPGETVYLHVRRRGRTLGTFRIGEAEGPCGNAARRMRYMPLARFSSGRTYDYYFQQARKFDSAQEYLLLRIFLFTAPA
jgi:hypothetical protein